MEELVFEEKYDFSNSVPLKNKGKIENVLDPLKLDPVIKQQAKAYYESLQINTIRPESKLKAVWYCILCAQEKLGEHAPAIVIANDLGLTKKQMESAIKKYHGRIPNYSPVGYVNPIEIIISYARIIGWPDEIIHEIREEWELFTRADSKLLQENSLDVAAGYISYFFDSKGFNVSLAEIMKEIMVTEKNLINAKQAILRAKNLILQNACA